MHYVPRFPFSLDPLIAEAKRRARRRRRLLGVGWLVLVLGGVAALVLTLGASHHPSGGGPVPVPGPATLVADGAAIVAPLPDGWSSSVGPGFQGAHRVAWVLMGDFRLPASAAKHEGAPTVPSRKVLVTIGDFYPAGPSSRWPSVKTLHMSPAAIASSRWWRVRWAGRALAIRVTFGSAPSARLIRQVEQVLSLIHRSHFR